MNMANHDGNVPENSDKILFAEEIVIAYFNHLDIPYQPSVLRAVPYREYIYNALTTKIKCAIFEKCSQLKEGRAYRSRDAHPSTPNRSNYEKSAKQLQEVFLKEGFDAKLFLFYCVNLLIDAEGLVQRIGAQEAGDLAVKFILEGFGDYDMSQGGWDVFNTAVASYVDDSTFGSISPDELNSSEEELDIEIGLINNAENRGEAVEEN